MCCSNLQRHFAEVALGSLLPTGTRSGPERARQHALRKLLTDDEVIAAQELEPVWRRAAQNWHIVCSFGVNGKEDRTVLWSGTRPGGTQWQT